MSAASQQTSTSQSSNQTGCVVDPLDLLDFTDYDSMPDGLPYESPSLSPSSSKAQFTARPPATVTPPTTLPPSTMSGPSHQYDQYKQQTPFVPGALASTMAVNQNNIAGYDVNYMPPEMTSPEDIFDFNTAGPAQNSMSSPEMDMDFEPSGDAGFFFESTVNPTAIGSREAQTPVATSNVGRMYPGMHQQAALAKARAAQQQQQQQIIQQQQRQQQQQQQQGVKHQRTKSNQPSDPIVEQKITQLLNSMRAQSAGSDGSGNSPLHNLPRTKKDEEDMDDDERLLNSEEGKKLSSKERRQLRNKVSARAFRSRRKEYISQLESEIASKVSENGDLRSQNRALMDENRRLSDLTRMLLSSSSFSNFLEHLSTNPAAPAPAQAAQPPQRAEQRREEPRQAPKDVNPYAAAQQAQPPTNMVMVPEQTMDFSMLNINNSNEAAFNYQPQVFSVVETPEMPEIDIAALSGKGSDNSSFESEQGKIEIPVAEAPVLLESAKPEMPEAPAPAPSSETAVADLDSDIFDDETVAPIKPENSQSVDLFAGVPPEKVFARYVLVDASDEEAVSNNAMMRVQRITASIEATMNRLERLTAGL